MERKKKYHGGLFLFFATLCALLFINTFSYAYMTKGYLDYTITTLHDNAYINNPTLLANFKSYLNNITEEQKTILLNNINTYMDNQGISNLQDRNIFCLINIPTLKFFICNNSAPGSTTNLDFYCIATDYIRKYSSSTIDYIYQINVDVSSSPTTITTFRFPNQTTVSGINFNSMDYTISQDGTVITSRNIATCGIPAGFQYVPLSNYNSSSKKACILQDVNGGYVEPTIPSGDSSSGDGFGNITNPSGENIGNINLQPIVDGLGNIQNQISGDTTRIIENQNNNTNTIVNTISGEFNNLTNTITDSADNTIDNTTITSGDITDSLGFTLMANPYSNFWYEMTQGLSTCLTGSVRSIPVDWLGFDGYFNLDGLINYPDSLKTILTTVSTVAMVWWLVKWWKIIIDKLTSGNVEEVLELNEEERHC